ncbi:MAG TPA: hypothetical protein DDW20_01730 [Firmicutes bacterium]|nr:hypothetical protein [Bacillota bacterium]
MKQKIFVIGSCIVGILPIMRNNIINVFAEKINYEEKQEKISIILEEVQKYSKEILIVKNSKTIFDFAENSYFLVTFKNKGYAVLNNQINDIVEISLDAQNEFANQKIIYYVPWNGFYLEKNNKIQHYIYMREINNYEIEYFRAFSLAYSQKAKIDKETFNNELMSIEDQEGKVDGQIVKADVEVPYSWYFKLNKNNFPENKDGYCGYVAASMLLAYHEIFISSGYFSLAQSSTYLCEHFEELNNNMWSNVPSLLDSFPKDMWGNDIGSSTPSVIHSAINSFMSGKDKQYEIYDFVWKFATIKDPIKDGVPAIYFGNMPMFNDDNPSQRGNHAIVVYGYFNNGKLLCHYGWPNYNQVIMSELGMFQQGGVLAIYNKSPHVHKGYFIDLKTNNIYCGCGYPLQY